MHVHTSQRHGTDSSSPSEALPDPGQPFFDAYIYFKIRKSPSVASIVLWYGAILATVVENIANFSIGLLFEFVIEQKRTETYT